MAFGRAADLPLLAAASTTQALLLVAADSAGTAGITDRLLLLILLVLLVAADAAGTADLRLLMVVAAGIKWALVMLLVEAGTVAGEGRKLMCQYFGW